MRVWGHVSLEQFQNVFLNGPSITNVSMSLWGVAVYWNMKEVLFNNNKKMVCLDISMMCILCILYMCMICMILCHPILHKERNNK